jgi:hypothetical protein
MIRTIIDYTNELSLIREKGLLRGDKTGFKCLDELYSLKSGTYTFVYAEPTHGKSEFIFEICMNQIQHGKRSLIYSPETGTTEEIIAELVHKYTGKRIYKTEQDSLTDLQFYDALGYLSEYFLIADTDNSYSVQDLFDLALQWEKENSNKKISIIVGEPYNELKHDMTQFNGRQDLYIEDLITNIRLLCRTHKKHFILSMHPSGNSIPITKDRITYYPKPLARQAAGGQASYRKAMTWITLWRPAFGLNDENGWAYAKDEVHVYIDKAKPKGVSYRGKCIMYFDWIKNRYYEKIDGLPYYAFEHNSQNNYFDHSVKKLPDLMPNLKFEPAKEIESPF